MTKPIIIVKTCYKLLYVIQVVFNFHYKVIHQYRLRMHLKVYANHLKGVQVMAAINLQCKSLSQIHSSVYFKLKIVRQVEYTWEKY